MCIRDRYTELKNDAEYLKAEKNRLEGDYKSACSKIEELAKGRIVTEQRNSELKLVLKNYKQVLSDKEELLSKQRIQLEEVKSQHIKLERRLNTSENMNVSLEREAEIAKDALNSKIKILEEQMQVEILNKKALLSHCDDERKTRAKTEESLAQSNYELELMKMKLATAESTLEIREKAMHELESDNDALQLQLRNTENQKSAMKLAIEKYTLLMKKLEETCEVKLEVKAQELIELRKECKLELARKELTNEDLRSRCIELNNKIHEYLLRVITILSNRR
eukprot:TRINITY_DN6486_c0_g1_i1.p1 TRINITY_DN6486_c0_g1~~TRINITY_DN6486_c0_g1_i1.p1  ORF type:complete len:280 (-),score=63.86 TRINITY_DN6486_c0_g1_i1:731-1570(-)